MSTWRKGPPPSVGWWPASYFDNPECIRWWNGKRWSECVFRGESISEVKQCAAKEDPDPWRIKWTDRPKSWPARSKT